jgi:hypothetical protein
MSSVTRRRLKVAVCCAAIGAVVALLTGVIPLPGTDQSTPPAAARTVDATTANQRWASALCTNVLNLKNEIHRDATSVASGNLRAIGSLVDDLHKARSAVPKLKDEMQRLGSVDMGLSLAETRACRQLVGIPI